MSRPRGLEPSRRRAGRLLGGVLVAFLATGCSHPLDRAAYRQACQAYSAALVAINWSDQFPSLSSGFAEFATGLKDARRAHDAGLTHAFEQLLVDARKIEAVNLVRQRVPQKLAANMSYSTHTIVGDCKAHGDGIAFKRVLHL